MSQEFEKMIEEAWNSLQSNQRAFCFGEGEVDTKNILTADKLLTMHEFVQSTQVRFKRSSCLPEDTAYVIDFEKIRKANMPCTERGKLVIHNSDKLEDGKIVYNTLSEHPYEFSV